MSSFTAFIGFCILLLPALAYVPAVPTNSSADAAGALDPSGMGLSYLHLQWFSNGAYTLNVSYQLVGQGSTGISKGVLTHFSEDDVNTLTPGTTTPWIALVSCDRNATDTSMDEDIFTLARDKGAVSAVLYSLYSEACVINPMYADPTSFDQVFDIFSSRSLINSQTIEHQFLQLNSTPKAKTFYSYNSQQLNDSLSNISIAVETGTPTSPGYLLGVLQAYNATGSISPPNTTNTNPNTQPIMDNSKSPNTGLAMIILYAITGVVSALFCIVIISGAIRAIRHPERYGPRARMGDHGGPPQSRARGLTRAILDTFPVVKFGSTAPSPPESDVPMAQDKDQRLQSVELGNLAPLGTRHLQAHSGAHNDTSAASGSGSTPRSSSIHSQHDENVGTHIAGASQDPINRARPPTLETGHSLTEDLRPSEEGYSQAVSRPPNSEAPEPNHTALDSIGRDTCPICIVDFEEGDDIRVLPCEGKHCFHQACVDPWLLKLSSSCPICRHDFLALENMLSGHSHDEQAEEEIHTRHSQAHLVANRFSRYLRFARRRHRRGDEPDPTDPYMPTAPDTPIFHGHS
ncbi:hypothetical protein D9619_001774 [Psilocybe cf. subviscida]|uniref:RING-type domain-containing protein n=1 Tax=Psilocybe cf. subviscida TaxID=2480587 RepID=A0A8H5F3L3_9AGAR|nr:hypothetical protein D9619_001774 [Psilocybe cf. subviscida]